MQSAQFTLETALFWAITQRVVVILYRPSRTTSLEDGTDVSSRNVGKELQLLAV